jgi:hypothetical protein
MKNLCILLILINFNESHGQDTAKSLNRNSISFNGGINVITGSSPLSISTGPWFSPIQPSISVQPCFSFSYNYVLAETKHFSYGLKLGIGYSQNIYKGEVCWEVAYGSPEPIEQINTGEFCIGSFINTTKKHTLGWYNELDFIGNVQLYSEQKESFFIQGAFENKHEIDLRLFYQTGISIRINRNFTVIPMVGYSIIDLSALFNGVNSYGIYGYRYLISGVTLTYDLNKG